MNQQPILAAYGISYCWKSPSKRISKRPVLDEVSFELFRGEILALLGPNGSGKSTLMKAVSGILPLRRAGCSGQVRFQGLDFLSLPVHRRAQSVVYVPPEITTDFPLTAEEMVSLGRTSAGLGLRYRTPEDQEMIRWAMEKCLCWSFRHRDLDELSGGEQQLVAMARALAQGGKILFLDETLSRMDLNHQSAIGKVLRGLAKEGWSILLVSHDVNLASEWSDRAIFLKNGAKVFEGSIAAAMTQEVVEKVYPDSNLVIGLNPVTGTPKVFFGRN